MKLGDPPTIRNVTHRRSTKGYEVYSGAFIDVIINVHVDRREFQGDKPPKRLSVEIKEKK